MLQGLSTKTNENICFYNCYNIYSYCTKNKHTNSYLNKKKHSCRVQNVNMKEDY